MDGAGGRTCRYTRNATPMRPGLVNVQPVVGQGELADVQVPAERHAPGLVGFQERRKASSRRQLLAAASEAFCAKGYFPVSVEDIAAAAGVSRMTFYRHYPSKAALAAELFEDASLKGTPLLLAIAGRDYMDKATVTAWIADLFAFDQSKRQLLYVFSQANTEPYFTGRAHKLIERLIQGLGQTIPAFALSPINPAHGRQWIKAWLLVYELLDQSNHAARGASIAPATMMIEVLAERFLDFVHDQP